MKKQFLLAGALAAVFFLAAAGTSFAGDHRGTQRDYRYGNGRHFTAQPHNGHWKRSFTPQHSRGGWNGHHAMPRHGMQHRTPNHRSGFQTPRHSYGQQHGDRSGHYQRPSNQYRQDRSGHGPSTGYDRTGQSYDGQDRSGSGQSDGAVASDEGTSSQGGHNSGGRQGRL